MTATDASGAADSTVAAPKQAAGASRSLAIWGLGGFVVLGLPDGMWGTAWPTMRQTFHQPLGSLGLILVFATCGNIMTSLWTGKGLRRFGVGPLLVGAGLIGAAGATILATASVWAMVLVGAFCIGATAGLLDTGLNIVVALSGRMRLMNMLHGAYGVGSALGPLVVTVAILWTSWRPAYVLLIGLELLLAYGWWRTHARPAAATDDEPVADVDADDGPARHVGLLIGLGVAMFFFNVGLEVSAGQWAASFFRGPLGLTAAAAGPAVFVYWGALTLSRFSIAIPKQTPRPELLVRIGCGGSLVAAAVIWWAPSTPVVIVGFAVMGAAIAPVFPALVTLTPIRIGISRTHRAIGWQVAAANVGGASVSALIGVILQHEGLRTLGGCLFVIAVLTIVCNVGLELFSRPASRLVQ
jgi:fucose permease